MMDVDLFDAVLPVVAEFDRLGVVWYIGGSVASTAYGFFRTTADADIIAELQVEHVEPLVEALAETFYVSGPMIHDAIRRQSCFNFIYYATSMKVDVFVARRRPYDAAAISRRQLRPIADTTRTHDFWLASPEDVILSKLEWYRLGDGISERQWSDILGVTKVQGPVLDREYLAHWAAELGVADLLERVWSEVG